MYIYILSNFNFQVIFCRRKSQTFFLKKPSSFNRQGKCVSYTYGGCHGTKNLFDSQEDCETACPSSSQMNSPRTGSAMWIQPPFCQNPPLLSSNGPQCQAYMPKYTFNSTTGMYWILLYRIQCTVYCKCLKVYFP